jgi:hypothetical protein
MQQNDAPMDDSMSSGPIEAANDEFHPAGRPETPAAPTGPGGWDPFEVWRTRVRDARRDDDGGTRR